MSRIKVRGIQQTPNKQDIPGPIVEIQDIPAGNVIGDILVWDGENWIPSDGNESNVPGATLAAALDYLGGKPQNAIVVSMFGTPGFRVWTTDQVTASNNESPALILTPPVEVGKMSIGPDGRIYSGSNSAQGIVAHTIPKVSGTISRVKVAHLGAGPSLEVFYGQSPATGIDPWRIWAPIGANGNRVNMGMANIDSNWVGIDTFTISPTGATDGCFDQAGNLWYTGTTGQETVRINVNGAPGIVTADIRFVGSNWPSSGQGIAIDSSGNMYRANYVSGAGSIRRCNAATIAAAVGAGPLNQVPDFTYTIPSMPGIEYIFFDHNDNLWVSCYEGTSVGMIAAADLASSGAKVPTVLLRGGGTLGNGGATGPVVIRPLGEFGPMR